MNSSRASEGTSGNWQLPWAPNYVTLEFFVSFVVLSIVSPLHPRCARELPPLPDAKSRMVCGKSMKKGFDFKHQSSHPPLRGCPSQGRMKFLRPKAGYEGRVGGHKKSAGFIILMPATTPSPVSRLPDNVKFRRHLRFQSFEDFGFWGPGTSMVEMFDLHR